MKRWALVLHFYQPPVQDLAITKQVLESSYMPVLRLLEEHPRARVTVNISACLLQQLKKLHKEEFFVSVRRLVAAGKIELLSGPAYHPVVPMIHREIFERQVQKTQTIYTDTLGIQPGKGLFLPELAVTSDVVEWISRLGFLYTVVDQHAVSGDVFAGQLHNVTCFVNNRSVTDIIRGYPGRLSAEAFSKWLLAQPRDIVSVNDVEAFGHHYEERLEVLHDLFSHPEFSFVTLSELNVHTPDVEIRPSSWQEVDWTAEKRGPFWLWDNPENSLQIAYKELADIAAGALDMGREKTEGYVWNAAAEHLDTGLSSCYLYWLSNWPWWHPDLVERGAQQLIKCIRTVTVDATFKQRGEEMYHLFLGKLWTYHWSGEVEKRYKLFDEERKELVARIPEL